MRTGPTFESESPSRINFPPLRFDFPKKEMEGGRYQVLEGLLVSASDALFRTLSKAP